MCTFTPIELTNAEADRGATAPGRRGGGLGGGAAADATAALTQRQSATADSRAHLPIGDRPRSRRFGVWIANCGRVGLKFGEASVEGDRRTRRVYGQGDGAAMTAWMALIAVWAVGPLVLLSAAVAIYPRVLRRSLRSAQPPAVSRLSQIPRAKQPVRRTCGFRAHGRKTHASNGLVGVHRRRR